MSPLIESIRIARGVVCALPFHQKRMERSMEILGGKRTVNLRDFFSKQQLPSRGVWKARIVYEEDIISCTITPYEKKIIASLQIVTHDEIDYSLKYEDRRNLAALFARRRDADDILIEKNGCVSDTYYCNVCFFDGQTWYTPDTPLLRGIMREKLLHSNTIQTRRIRTEDIHSYEKVMCINALLPPGALPPISTECIYR
ncbi:MAG: aminotransferase class IV [Fibrobacterota bacterium]